MKDRAKITSAEALDAFRASLLVYVSKARPALEEMVEEVRQTRVWLECDRQPHWLAEARRRKRALDDARQELFSAQLRNQGDSKAFQQMAVTRAQSALKEAEEKLTLIHRWIREFENLSAPLAKQIEQVNWTVSSDLKQAAAYLSRVVAAVEDYLQEAPALESAPVPTGGRDSVESAPTAPAIPAELPAPPAAAPRESAAAATPILPVKPA
jgi:hypothetical protein